MDYAKAAKELRSIRHELVKERLARELIHRFVGKPNNPDTQREIMWFSTKFLCRNL